MTSPASDQEHRAEPRAPRPAAQAPRGESAGDAAGAMALEAEKNLVDGDVSHGLKRVFVLALIIVACVLLVALTPIREWLDADRVLSGHWLDAFGAFAPVVFVAGSALGIALAVPRVLFAALAGAVFGIGPGLVVAHASAVLGCWLNFAYARALGRPFVERRLGARFVRLKGLLDLIGRHGLAGNVMLRSLPVGNAFMLNLLMAVSPVRAGAFVLGTAIGALPSTVVYTLLGSGVRSDPALKVGLGAGLLVLWCVAYLVFLRRVRRKRAAGASLPVRGT